MIVNYYSQYQKSYIGDMYDNKEEAVSDVKDLLKLSPKNQMEEILNEINHNFKNKDLRRTKNINQINFALTIALCINEIMHEKEKELGE